MIEKTLNFTFDDIKAEEYAKEFENENVATIDEIVVQSRALKQKLKNEEIHFKKYNALAQLCEEPKQGEQFRIITEKQFNAYALIQHLVESRIIEEMYLAIYRINEPTVDKLIEFIEDKKILKATFVISSFFNQTKKPEVWAMKLREYCLSNPSQCKHIYCHNHSKVFACKTGTDYFVFEGSGNMSDNARIEQYVYENNKKVFEWHKAWMSEVQEKEGEFK